MSVPASEEHLEHWVSKSEIADVLATHSRGIDRADKTLLSSAYHADAQVDYGFFSGDAGQLAAILAKAQEANPVTMHRTSNLWIKTLGDCARSESYVFAYAEHVAGDPAVQRFIGGRYLDTHQRRSGQWRLSHRKYVMDFNINRPSTTNWQDPAVALAKFLPRGGHGAADAGRALLALHSANFKSDGNSPVTTNDTDRRIELALSKLALHELNMAYARAVDRADTDLMRSVFHDDATVVTGIFNGRAAEYADTIVKFVRENLERCFHSVANEWYEIDGDRAVGETYVIANVTTAGKDHLTGGRYIDAFERRNGVWKIHARTFVVDWMNSQPSSYEDGGMYASLKTRGCYGKDDPVYAFWNP